MNTKNLLILLSSLLIGVTLGLAATLMIKKMSIEEKQETAPPPFISHPSNHNGTIPASTGNNNENSEEENDEPKEIEIIYDTPKRVGQNYTVSVYAKHIPDGVNAVYRLAKSGSKNYFESTDGLFINIPGTPQGYYDIYVVDANIPKVLASDRINGFNVDYEVEKMTVSQIQTLILNQHDTSLLGGKNPKVKKNLVIKIVQIREGERRPDDIQSVRDKIANGIWESAKVISVTYDEQGRINSVTISPKYSNNE